MHERGSLARVLERWLGPVRQERDAELISALNQHINELHNSVETLRAEVRELKASTPVAPEPDTSLRETLAALEKQIGRSGREQFKANTLAETQASRLADALEALRAADARREEEIAALRDQSRAAETSARLDVARSILPALDGLDEAIRSGRQILDSAAPEATSQSVQHSADEPESGGWFRALFGPPPAPPQPRTEPQAEHNNELRVSLDSWLVGLTYVRQRLLDALAKEGIKPIDAEGQDFDPRLHVVLEVVPARNDIVPGAVAHELRRGYMVGDRVLRHSEVAVAKES